MSAAFCCYLHTCENYISCTEFSQNFSRIFHLFPKKRSSSGSCTFLPSFERPYYLTTLSYLVSLGLWFPFPSLLGFCVFIGRWHASQVQVLQSLQAMAEPCTAFLHVERSFFFLLQWNPEYPSSPFNMTTCILWLVLHTHRKPRTVFSSFFPL